MDAIRYQMLHRVSESLQVSRSWKEFENELSKAGIRLRFRYNTKTNGIEGISFTLAKENNIHTCIDTSGITYKPGNEAYNAKLDKVLELTDLVMLDIKHIDPEKHKDLTSQPNDGILAFANLLSDKGIDIWIRHVVVPGITDDDVYLDKLGYFIGGLHTLKGLEVLPYHDMAKPKYENLGIDYVLKDVPPMDKGKALEKRQVIMEGVKRRRMDDSKK